MLGKEAKYYFIRVNFKKREEERERGREGERERGMFTLFVKLLCELINNFKNYLTLFCTSEIIFKKCLFILIENRVAFDYSDDSYCYHLVNFIYFPKV